MSNTCAHGTNYGPCPHCKPSPIERALETQADAVNHPSHYTAGKVECIDALEAATFDLSGLEAVCTANAIKYLWRWKRKGGHEDLRKARWYINRLLGDTP
jgi:hypothetical protein